MGLNTIVVSTQAQVLSQSGIRISLHLIYAIIKLKILCWWNYRNEFIPFNLEISMFRIVGMLSFSYLYLIPLQNVQKLKLWSRHGIYILQLYWCIIHIKLCCGIENLINRKPRLNTNGNGFKYLWCNEEH